MLLRAFAVTLFSLCAGRELTPCIVVRRGESAASVRASTDSGFCPEDVGQLRAVRHVARKGNLGRAGKCTSFSTSRRQRSVLGESELDKESL